MRDTTVNVWMSGLVCAIVLLAGCETSKQAKITPPTTRPVASLEDTRLALVKANQQVDATLTAIDRLASQPANVPQAYSAFATEVAQADTDARQADLRSQQMNDQWRLYADMWEQKTNQISTPQLQASADQQRQAVSQDYNRLRDAARGMQAAYPPFLTHLHEIERTLSLDKTPAGVNTVQPAFDVARKSAQDLKQKIDAFISDIDQVMAAPGQTEVSSAASTRTGETGPAAPR